MHADPKLEITQLLRAALQNVAPDMSDAVITLERPRDASHGDFATNLALQLAKASKRNPRELAQALVAALPSSALLKKVDLAGPGFINFTLNTGVKTDVVKTVLTQKASFGRGGRRQQKVQVEFVSANPTGPLHVGHGRGAAYGAALASVLDFAGYEVEREYYVNDAGRQMDILAVSTWLRYLALCGEVLPFPPNGYQGEYVQNMAQQLLTAHGARFAKARVKDIQAQTPGLPAADRNDPEAKAAREVHLDALIAYAKAALGEDFSWLHNFVLTEQLGDCREDLAQFRVRFEHWFSEKSLFDTGLVARAIAELTAKGHVYEQDGAKWFRSTQFGDEKDRVVQRENGLFTYFASDIAYHVNKFERGFDRMINIWGADHHGYIARVKGALTALGFDANKLDIALVQFAVLYRDGQKAPMSTRSGEFVTLRNLRDEVGVDACRFFYVLRKSDQHLDFDLDLAKSQKNENPVYYIQYAHARACSVLSQWSGVAADLEKVDLAPLVSEQALGLCASLSEFPEIIQAAATDYAPHQIAFYLKDLAGLFHSWYNAERIIVEDVTEKEARLALTLAVKHVLANGLELLGVSAPHTM